MPTLIDLDYEIIRIPKHEEIKGMLLPHILERSAKIPHTSVKKSNVGGWQSDYELYDEFDNLDNPLTQLFTPVLEKFEEYTNTLTLRSHLSLNLRFGYWANVNYKGNFNIPHNHNPETQDVNYTLLSGCYYLKKPQNSGNMVFANSSYYLKNFFENDVDTEIDLSEGECILFPTTKTHYVLPNESNDVRVSIAFNIEVKG